MAGGRICDLPYSARRMNHPRNPAHRLNPSHGQTARAEAEAGVPVRAAESTSTLPQVETAGGHQAVAAWSGAARLRAAVQWGASWLVSGGTHAVLLLALGLLVIGQRPGSQPYALLGSFAVGEAALDHQATIAFDLDDNARDNQQAANSRAAATTRGLIHDDLPAEIDVQPLERSDPPSGEVADRIAAAIGGGKVDDKIVTPPASQAEGEVIGKGYASFFGIEAKGYKFVYVVDASGSMFGRRFQKAYEELVQSLTALDEHQSFYVIFFNAVDYPQYYPLAASNFSPVSPKSLEKVSQWMTSVIPHGSTVPNSALSRALALAPDAIFFLSDGEFSEEAGYLVRRENYRRTPIHTIAFESEMGGPQLARIAKMTGGTYRFVP